MNMLLLKKCVIASICLASLIPFSAKAAPIEFDFGQVFTGVGPVSSVQPWVKATLQDGLTPGTVLLTVSNPNLTGAESVDELYINLNPTYSPNNLIFTLQSSTPGFTIPTISEGVNSFKADGDGKYDVLFQFSQGAGAFGVGDSIVYSISGGASIPNLNPMDFAYMSAPAGGNGPFYSAIHVQRITTPAGESSGWVAPLNNQYVVIPEPGSGMLGLLAGAVALALRSVWRPTKSY
jgi:hypothetical protein